MENKMALEESKITPAQYARLLEDVEQSDHD